MGVSSRMVVAKVAFNARRSILGSKLLTNYQRFLALHTYILPALTWGLVALRATSSHLKQIEATYRPMIMCIMQWQRRPEENGLEFYIRGQRRARRLLKRTNTRNPSRLLLRLCSNCIGEDWCEFLSEDNLPSRY